MREVSRILSTKTYEINFKMSKTNELLIRYLYEFRTGLFVVVKWVKDKLLEPSVSSSSANYK